MILVDRTSLLFEGASVCIGQMKSKCHTDLQVEASKMAPRNFSLAVSLAKKMGYSMPSLDLVESSKVEQNQFWSFLKVVSLSSYIQVRFSQKRTKMKAQARTIRFEELTA